MTFLEKLTDFSFRVYRIIGRQYIRYSSNPRPVSMPFITGDGFRSIAHHIYDANETITSPHEVRNKDIIFVGDSLIEKFITDIHPYIQSRYILITHNGDATVTNQLLQKVTKKIIRWYGVNVLVTSPKVIPIPIGIENKNYFVCGIPSVFHKVRKISFQKKDKIFYAFSVHTNPSERKPALDQMEQHPLGSTLNQWRGFRAYLIYLNQFKFVISPPGSSVEGIRTWDSMYIGSIPIVKSSITIDYFKQLGLPLLVVNDWSDLQNITQENIASLYASIKKGSRTEALYLKYWIDKIKSEL